MELCRPVDRRLEKNVTLESIQLDAVELFRYLEDKICPGGGCELATISQKRAASGKFHELLPLLTSTTISLARCGRLYDSCVRGTLLHVSKCWPPRKEEVQCLLGSKQAMLCWMLKIKAEDNVSLSTMYGRLNLASLESKLRLNHLIWFGHVERSEKWVNKCTHLEIDDFKGSGRPRKTWSATVTKDLKTWNIDANNAHDRPVWKALRTAIKSQTHRNRGQVAANGK